MGELHFLDFTGTKRGYKVTFWPSGRLLYFGAKDRTQAKNTVRRYSGWLATLFSRIEEI